MRTSKKEMLAGGFATALGALGLSQTGAWADSVWRFPIAVCIALVLLGLGLLSRGTVKTLRTSRAGGAGAVPAPAVDTGVVTSRAAKEVAIVSAAVVVAVLLLQPVGFLPTAVVLTTGLVALLSLENRRVPWVRVVPFSVVLVAAVYFLFVGVLNVDL